MDVILDTNILIADIWQNSQNFRFFIDYIGKTNSTVLIPSVVDIEVKSYFNRKVSESIQEIETSIRRAERFGVSKTPILDYENIKNTTIQSWDILYETLFKSTHGKIIPITQTVVNEAIWREAYRLPPCKEDGDGIRDCFIWLQSLEYCTARINNDPIAFISMNIHDFANQDKVTLRDELTVDLRGIKLLYYPSLEYFLKEYAKPISHITEEWLNEHIDYSIVERSIYDYLNSRWQGDRHKEKFQIIKSEYRDHYQIINSVQDIVVRELRLDGFIVWEFDANHIELSLDFFAYIEGETEGELVNSPYFSNFEKNEFRPRKNLNCFAELVFHFAATIDDDNIEIGDIDDVNSA